MIKGIGGYRPEKSFIFLLLGSGIFLCSSMKIAFSPKHYIGKTRVLLLVAGSTVNFLDGFFPVDFFLVAFYRGLFSSVFFSEIDKYIVMLQQKSGSARMKTLRFLLKGSQVDDRERRGRKISLPVNHLSETTPAAANPGNMSIWQNVKRKLSISVVSNEAVEQDRPFEYQTSTSLTEENKFKKEQIKTDSPKGRRGNSQVGEEDVLHFAIVESDIELFKSIMKKHKVNVNYLRPPGTAPLHQACTTGCLELVELLVQNGANVYLRDFRDLTPLQIANCNGHFEIAEYLLRMGSPVIDIKDGFQIRKPRRKRSSCFAQGPRW